MFCALKDKMILTFYFTRHIFTKRFLEVIAYLLSSSRQSTRTLLTPAIYVASWYPTFVGIISFDSQKLRIMYQIALYRR